MSWNLPPGCTDADIDRAFGGEEGRRGVYTVTIVRTIELTIDVDASSHADAEQDAKHMIVGTPLEKWKVLDEDVVVLDPLEPDPDDARDARIDWEMDRDR